MLVPSLLFLGTYLFVSSQQSQHRKQGAAGNVIVLHPTKTAMTFCDIDPGRWIDVPASISFHVKFQRWDVANPRTTTPFHFMSFVHCHFYHSVQTKLELLDFKSMSGGNDLAQLKVLVTREVSASNSLHLALAMAMVTCRYFSGHFTDRFLSGIAGVFFAFHIRIRKDCSEQVCNPCWIRHGGMNPSGNTFPGRNLDPRPHL